MVSHSTVACAVGVPPTVEVVTRTPSTVAPNTPAAATADAAALVVVVLGVITEPLASNSGRGSTWKYRGPSSSCTEGWPLVSRVVSSVLPWTWEGSAARKPNACHGSGNEGLNHSCLLYTS